MFEAILRDRNGTADRRIIGTQLFDMTGNHVADYRNGSIYEVGSDKRISHISSPDLFPPSS